jgi:oligopeptide transport system ATP-binding protein
MALESPTAGQVFYQGRDIFAMGPTELRHLRRQIQIIFQDPYTSLNPRMTVGTSSGSRARSTRRRAEERAQQAVRDLLDRVGPEPRLPQPLPAPVLRRAAAAHRDRPRPRAAARGAGLRRAGVRAGRVGAGAGDQPAEDLQEEFGLSYLFIAHDLSVVRHISDRVNVMYLGKVIETGTNADVYDRPAHPYTQALLSAVPSHDPAKRGSKTRIVLQGDLPSAANPPSGCRFRTRCWKAQGICAEQEPLLVDRGQGHPSACHFADAADVVGGAPVPELDRPAPTAG